MDLTNRNYSTISPSAKSLLLMKGHTNIPFARRAAELIEKPKEYQPDFDKRDLTFWARTLHFENRYWSIDQLLTDIPVKNILELSSGFSFRGLEVTKREGFYYIDTDLLDVIAMKKNFVNSLRDGNFETKGVLELLPLNALNEKEFNEIVSHFPEGEIVIVNEGLLMYLDDNEKEKLCGIIQRILRKHGGYWITADIYIKNKHEKLDLKFDNETKDFFDKHQIEDNKFESFKDAETFFKRMGFEIDREAKVKRSQLESMKYFMKSITIRQLFRMIKTGKIQVTWRLKAVSSEYDYLS